MGNGASAKRKNTKKGLATELVDINYADQCAEEEYIDKTNCCWLQFQAVKKRKIIWQHNFITHCTLIKDEFKWASQMIQLVSLNPKGKSVFYKEVNNLKEEIRVVASENQRDILVTPSQVQQFKNNLKKSVLLSAGYANKYHHQNSHKSNTNMSMSMRPSRIQFNRFRNSNPRRNTINSKKFERSNSINSMSSSKSGLRKSIMSFMDDTLSSVFGAERQVSKQVANGLQAFLKFTMILEKHFNDSQCMLSIIKKKFIDYIVRTYADSVITAQNIEELVDSINQFMTILKQAIIDYYNLNSFVEGQFSNPFIGNEQNILSLCRTIFFKEKAFYEVIFNGVVKYNAKRQAKFAKIIKLLENEQPETFFVHKKFCLNQSTIDQALHAQVPTNDYIKDIEPYRQCKLILNQLQKSMTPVKKMKIILSCSQTMNKQIEKFYDANGLQRQKWVLDADQVLAIFQYLIINSKINNLHSHLFILEHFSTSSQMISVFGYYLSVMSCAVEQLQSDYYEKVKSEHNEEISAV